MGPALTVLNPLDCTLVLYHSLRIFWLSLALCGTSSLFLHSSFLLGGRFEYPSTILLTFLTPFLPSSFQTGFSVAYFHPTTATNLHFSPAVSCILSLAMTMNQQYTALKDEVQKAEQIRKTVYSILWQEQRNEQTVVKNRGMEL
jgi:hypothetical protein